MKRFGDLTAREQDAAFDRWDREILAEKEAQQQRELQMNITWWTSDKSVLLTRNDPRVRAIHASIDGGKTMLCGRKNNRMSVAKWKTAIRDAGIGTECTHCMKRINRLA